MELFEYPDGSGYEARFDRCGICTLMQELGLYDLTSAMCRLDYTMSDAGGASDFVREYTLASGGPFTATAAITAKSNCRLSTEQGKIRTALTRFVIGGNAHSACWGSNEFAEDYRKIGTFCRTNVGIIPYNRRCKYIQIRRKST